MSWYIASIKYHINKGRRLDTYERPELSHGAVEYIATGDYMMRAPQPPVYMFLLDVSQRSIATGFVAEACRGIKETLQNERIIFFYDLSSALRTCVALRALIITMTGSSF
jgi:hypothetical protein